MQVLDKHFIKQKLSYNNIPCDSQVIEEVHAFLAKYIGPLDTQDANYHIPAACAIIC